MDVDELLVREAIRDLIARYTWAGDRGDSAGLAGLFTPNGVLDVGEHGGVWDGAARIKAELDAVTERVAASGDAPGPVRHHVSSVRITVESATAARSDSYFAVYTSIGLDHWGRYRDRFERSGTEWLFSERRVRVDGHSPGSLMVRH